MTAKTPNPKKTSEVLPWSIVRKLSDGRELTLSRCLTERLARNCAYYLSVLNPGDDIKYRRDAS